MRKLLCAVLAALMLLSLSGCIHFGPIEYTVTFDPNGGKIVYGNTEQKVEKGKNAMEPIVEREGFEFDGWDGSTTNITDNVTLKAKWKEYYEITFVYEEVDETRVVTVLEGEKPEPPSDVFDGYEVEGWTPEIKAASRDTEYTAKMKRLTLDAEELYELASPCVAEIVVMDRDGDPFASGSGFFIDDKGTMVTNFHVMEGAYSATATMLNGEEYDILYVISYDQDIDIALVKADVSGNDFLEIAEEDPVTGEKVYTIGSSLGLSGTLSDGLVSTASREVEGNTYIQITAPISHGNSGGPLMDEFGRVLGINTGGLSDGQNLNFAVPIYQLDNMSRTGRTLMEDFGEMTGTSSDDDVYLTVGGFFDTTDSDYWEVEYNDTIILADPIISDIGYAAVIVNEDDIDVFRIHVDSASDIVVKIIPYYKSDCGAIAFAVCDEEVETFFGDDLDAIIGEEDPDNGNQTDNLYITLPGAGDYYLAVYDAYGCDIPFFYAVTWEYT